MQQFVSVCHQSQASAAKAATKVS
jgi:hypothetical protein